MFLETPANPTLIMTDIERAADGRGAASRQAGRHGGQHVPRARLSSTRCMLGADICLYSATKYLSGYSDMLGGVAITESSDMIQKIRSRARHVRQHSAARRMLDARWPPPTVALRMNRQSKNAQRIAEALHGHKLLSRVIYPTLFTDPEQKRIFEKQCDYPRRHVLASNSRAARKRRSNSCATCGSRATPSRWAAWNR